ncbi:hypothetical protein THOM_1423, partial [Trachipleistophora hominis]
VFLNKAYENENSNVNTNTNADNNNKAVLHTMRMLHVLLSVL